MTTLTILGIIFVIFIIWVLIEVRTAKNPALNKEELRFVLIITLVGAFTGVWGAFTLTEYDQQAELNQVTKQKLRLAILEAVSTCKTVDSVLSGYLASENPLEIWFPTQYPSVSAAQIALYDENIHTIVPEYKISLLFHYTHLITTFVEYGQMYQDAVLGNKGGGSSLHGMRSTSAEALAVCKHLVSEFAEYYETENDPNVTESEIAKGEDTIKKLKERALAGDNILEDW